MLVPSSLIDLLAQEAADFYNQAILAGRPDKLNVSVKEVGNIKVVGDQRPCIAVGSSLLQNRFQAINEIVTILVAV